MSDDQKFILALFSGIVGLITFEIVATKKGVKARVRGKVRKKR